LPTISGINDVWKWQFAPKVVHAEIHIQIWNPAAAVLHDVYMHGWENLVA
jgi:hypothetical protein